MANFSCFKCAGSGNLSGFSHIANGVCFQCDGSGTLSYKARKDAFQYTDKPGFPVLSEADQCSMKQWEFMEKLADGSDDKFRRCLALAGCPYATRVYVSRKMMSRAIDIAKGAGA